MSIDFQIEYVYPARNGFAITPDDSNDMPNVTRASMVGTAGEINVTTFNKDTFVLYGCQTGQIIPVQARRVWATGTSATNIIGLY